MTPGSTPVLTLLGDDQLFESAERTAAAAGLRVIRGTTPARKNWSAAAVVILDLEYARECESAGMPRRDGVVLVSAIDPPPELWSVALALGAQGVFRLPVQEADLVRLLSELADSYAAGGRGRRSPRVGPLVAVAGGRGGAGASVFAAALAQTVGAAPTAGEALLVDLDPCGGGIDLLMGAESTAGLRWPDLVLQAGRLSWTAVRDALPRRNGVAVLSSTRVHCDIDADAALAVVEAGRRGGATVICDVPRRLVGAVGAVVESADLVAVVTTCDVRGTAAAAATVCALRAVNPHLGLVVRGPAPGGLRAAEVVGVVSAPLLAAMRPEPLLDQRLEQGGLRLGRRSPLAAAARGVLSVLDQRGGVLAA